VMFDFFHSSQLSTPRRGEAQRRRLNLQPFKNA
jgi:hypothetical protein